MARLLSTPVAAFSVVLDYQDHGNPALVPVAFEQLIARLLSVFEKHRVPATWAGAEPAVGGALLRDFNATGHHEFALIGDISWIGAGRMRFGRELNRRTACVRAAGMHVSALMLRDAQLDEDADLAARHGISAVWTTESAQRSRWTPGGTLSPRPVHYGLWDIPVTAYVGISRRWIWRRRDAAQYALDQAVATRLSCHCHISLRRLLLGGITALRQLEKVVERAILLRDRGELEIATLAELSMRLSANQRQISARSILRAA